MIGRANCSRQSCDSDLSHSHCYLDCLDAIPNKLTKNEPRVTFLAPPTPPSNGAPARHPTRRRFLSRNTALDEDQWLGPGTVLPRINAEPPGGRACGAIAGQLIQAAGKSVSRLQPIAAAIANGQSPAHDTAPRLLEAGSGRRHHWLRFHHLKR